MARSFLDRMSARNDDRTAYECRSIPELTLGRTRRGREWMPPPMRFFQLFKKTIYSKAHLPRKFWYVECVSVIFDGHIGSLPVLILTVLSQYWQFLRKKRGIYSALAKMAQNLSNNTTKKHRLMVFMILDRELNAYYTRLVHAVVSNISKYERPCLTKHREESWKYDAQWSIFDKLRGVWKCVHTLSWAFDISSQSKLKLRRKRRNKIIKICAN